MADLVVQRNWGADGATVSVVGTLEVGSLVLSDRSRGPRSYSCAAMSDISQTPNGLSFIYRGDVMHVDGLAPDDADLVVRRLLDPAVAIPEGKRAGSIPVVTAAVRPPKSAAARIVGVVVGLALGLLAVIGMVAVAHPSSSPGASSGSSGTQGPLPAVDASTHGPICTAVSDTQDALNGVVKSTDTTSETVSKLDKAQSDWGDAARAADTAASANLISDTGLSSQLTAIQTDVGHIKVDVDSGADTGTDANQLTSDIKGLPSMDSC